MPRATKDKIVTGYNIYTKLRQNNVPFMNACVLKYLIAHPELIPEDWKKEEDTFIYFWGTLYRHASGVLKVRFMYRIGEEWISSSQELSHILYGRSYAAVFANDHKSFPQITKELVIEKEIEYDRPFSCALPALEKRKYALAIPTTDLNRVILTDKLRNEGWVINANSDNSPKNLETVFLYRDIREGRRDFRNEVFTLSVLNSAVLDFLLAHPELIPEDWKEKEVSFWGTIYFEQNDDWRHPSRECVRTLFWNNTQSKWSWWMTETQYPFGRNRFVAIS